MDSYSHDKFHLDKYAYGCLYEMTAIVEAKTRAGIPKWLWFGLSDFTTEGSFVLASSGQTAVHTNWASGEPNNKGDEDCVIIAHDNKWNDRSCTTWSDYFV